MNSSTIFALAAVFGAALLAIIMLLLIIRQLRVDQNVLRDQLAGTEAQWADSQQQQGALQAVVQDLQHQIEDAKGMEVVAPIEWRSCPSCQTKLEIVLCPFCKAPYHKSLTTAGGKTLQCWDRVLQNGRCWNCRNDLTPFQRAGGAVTPATVPLPVAPPVGATGGPATPGTPPEPAPVPRNLRPTRQESPPDPTMQVPRRTPRTGPTIPLAPTPDATTPPGVEPPKAQATAAAEPGAPPAGLAPVVAETTAAEPLPLPRRLPPTRPESPPDPTMTGPAPRAGGAAATLPPRPAPDRPADGAGGQRDNATPQTPPPPEPPPTPEPTPLRTRRLEPSMVVATSGPPGPAAAEAAVSDGLPAPPPAGTPESPPAPPAPAPAGADEDDDFRIM